MVYSGDAGTTSTATRIRRISLRKSFIKNHRGIMCLGAPRHASAGKLHIPERSLACRTANHQSSNTSTATWSKRSIRAQWDPMRPTPILAVHAAYLFPSNVQALSTGANKNEKYSSPKTSQHPGPCCSTALPLLPCYTVILLPLLRFGGSPETSRTSRTWRN